MMLRAIATAGLLISVSACKSEAEQATQEFILASQNKFQPQEACAAARRVKDAYLRAGNQTQYEQWSVNEFNACFSAQMNGYPVDHRVY